MSDIERALSFVSSWNNFIHQL